MTQVMFLSKTSFVTTGDSQYQSPNEYLSGMTLQVLEDIFLLHSKSKNIRLR